MSTKTGVLIVNLGTPDEPTTSAVRRYLREFLSDPRVIDIHPIARWMLLNFLILPFRPSKSAYVYKKVWMSEGSPLLVHGRALTSALAQTLAPWPVKLAMRYGTPSIKSMLDELNDEGCDRLILFPLYPHYASSSTGSTLEEVYSQLSKRWNAPSLVVVPPYFDDQRFLSSIVEIAQPTLASIHPEHYLFSFHGLPERHMKKSDESKGQTHCLKFEGCCEEITYANRHCYRAQCIATTKGLVKKLNLTSDQYTVSFQSRLGRDPWIKPYTDHVIIDLAQKGIKSLVVFCPAFTADCLETLEEIGMAAKESFQEHGGEDLVLVPSLNAHPAWIKAATSLIRSSSPAELIQVDRETGESDAS